MNLTSFPHVDGFSADINAVNGVLVARNPWHNRGYTVAELLIMAFLGGMLGDGACCATSLLNEFFAAGSIGLCSYHGWRRVH